MGERGSRHQQTQGSPGDGVRSAAIQHLRGSAIAVPGTCQGQASVLFDRSASPAAPFWQQRERKQRAGQGQSQQSSRALASTTNMHAHTAGTRPPPEYPDSLNLGSVASLRTKMGCLWGQPSEQGWATCLRKAGMPTARHYPEPLLPPRGQAQAPKCLETTGTMRSGLRGARGAAEAIEDGSDLVGMQARSRVLGMEHLLPPRLGLGAAAMPHPGATLRAQSAPRGLSGGARNPFRGVRAPAWWGGREGLRQAVFLCGKEIVTRRGSGRLSRQAPQTTDRHTAAMRLVLVAAAAAAALPGVRILPAPKSVAQSRGPPRPRCAHEGAAPH